MLPLAHNCYIFEQSIVYVQHWQSIIYAQKFAKYNLRTTFSNVKYHIRTHTHS